MGKVFARSTGFTFDFDQPSEIKVIKADPNEFIIAYQSLIISGSVKCLSQRQFLVTVEGEQIEVTLQTELERRIEAMGMAQKVQKKVTELVAPMPGTIVDLSVTTGQHLSQGDPILVLEAMKMENIFKSPQDGVVKSIKITTGQIVEKGQTLIEFE